MRCWYLSLVLGSSMSFMTVRSSTSIWHLKLGHPIISLAPSSMILVVRYSHQQLLQNRWPQSRDVIIWNRNVVTPGEFIITSNTKRQNLYLHFLWAKTLAIHIDLSKKAKPLESWAQAQDNFFQKPSRFSSWNGLVFLLINSRLAGKKCEKNNLYNLNH